MARLTPHVLRILYLFAAAAGGANITAFTPPDELGVGINLPPLATDGLGVEEWKVTSTRMFRDLFKHATVWQVERASFENGEQAETASAGIEPCAAPARLAPSRERPAPVGSGRATTCCQ